MANSKTQITYATCPYRKEQYKIYTLILSNDETILHDFCSRLPYNCNLLYFFEQKNQNLSKGHEHFGTNNEMQKKKKEKRLGKHDTW